MPPTAIPHATAGAWAWSSLEPYRERIDALAKARQGYHPDLGEGTSAHDRESTDLLTHWKGVAGEFTWTRDVDPDFVPQVYETSLGDPGYDVRYGAWLLDVKASRVKRGVPNLLIPVAKVDHLVAHAFPLVHLEGSPTDLGIPLRSRLLGWAMREEIVASTEVREPPDGKPKCKVVRSRDLHAMDDIWVWLVATTWRLETRFVPPVETPWGGPR